MDFGSGKKTTSTKKDSDVLDDLLGDLLADDSPTKKRGGPSSQTPTRHQKGGPAKGGNSSVKDEAFYSSLAAMADSDPGSDVSEADVDKVAHSLRGLDDMDADLFGDSLSKKGGSGRSGKPTTPRRNPPKSKGAKSPRVQSPTRSDTPTSPPGSARGSLKKKPVKPPSPSTTAAATAMPQAQPEHKPGTAPGKMNDLSSASESLRPNQPVNQRPDTAPKLKKKYDFGDFDPDDPLAGVLSDEDFDDLSESDRPKSATKKPAAVAPSPSQEEIPKSQDRGAQDSPRRRNNLMDRPPTRSGSGDNTAASNVESAAKPVSKPPQRNIFSDSDDLLDGLGLEGKAPDKKPEVTHKPKAGGDSEELRPARSVFDSLLGKGGNSAADLLEPKEKKQFVLDSKYSQSNTGSGDVKDTDEDDFNFGSYQPSAATGSRPSSRRSVRFQDDDDIFGLDNRPSPRSKSPRIKAKAPADMDWLEAETNKPSPATPEQQPATNTSAVPSGSGGPSVTAKPPTPSGARVPESPKKSPRGPAPQTVSNTAPSPRAWLGLDESSDEEELFKPKRSASRSANLPQSPAVSVGPSPRVPPKKVGKKEVSSSPQVTTPTGSVNAANDDNEEDDWLARAKSRRQQMLSKEEGKTAEIDHQIDTDRPSSRPGEDGHSMRVDLSSLMMDLPKFAGTSTAQGDIFSTPQGRLTNGPTWESPRSSLSATIAGTPAQQGQLTGGPSLVDPRLKFSAANFDQTQSLEQQFLLQQQQQKQQQQQQQQQQQFMQQQKKTELMQQQQQLEQMLQNVQSQYNSVNQVSSVSMPSYAHITGSVELPDSLPEAHNKIRKLALEKHYSESMLDSTRRRYEDELMAVETSYKNRLNILEESNKKKETRLREENENLMEQHISRVRQLELEKEEVSSANYRKLEALERDRAKDLENLREQHRLSTQTLKREHEEALERLAAAKNQEISLVANANDTSKSLTAVVEQIQNNARDLGELQLKVDSWNRQGLDQREISLRSKDEQLRMLQERLQRQEEDNERERKRLEELIARMETQLREQTRSMEEEKWKLKQDQSRAEAQQRALEEERRLWLEQQARERVTMERSRENYLEEQRGAMSQLSDERRLLVEERTKFQAEQKTSREKMHHDAIKHSQAETDYEVLMRTIDEEKAHHSSRMQDLHKEEDRLSAERNKLERDRKSLDQERDQLADQAHQIRQQSSQIDRMTEAASRTRNEGEEAMDEALRINSQIEKREAEVQRQQNGFRLMEDHISQEKLRLAKEKKEVENLKSSSLCVNCRSPLQGGVVYPSPLKENGYHVGQYMGSVGQYMGSVGVSPIHSTPLPQPGHNPLDQIAASIAGDRAVRMLKIQAIKDKEFLEEESIYLESLRHTPYHSAAPKT